MQQREKKKAKQFGFTEGGNDEVGWRGKRDDGEKKGIGERWLTELMIENRKKIINNRILINIY